MGVSPAYVLRRLLQMLLVMWLVGTIVFFLFRVVPSDPAAITLGIDATQEAKEAYRAQLGLDRPAIVQYLSWLGGLVVGDLGTAFTQGNAPVTTIVFPALIRTLELALAATVIGMLIAVPIGILSAVRSGTAIDRVARSLAIAGFSIPSFWLGILLLLLFAVRLRWFPIGGWSPLADGLGGHLRSLALPALTVGLIMGGILLRFMRASMVEVLREDFVRTARAKGASERRVNYVHALRNAAIPFVTATGMQFGLLVGGMVVVEQVFAWPGLGWLMIQSIKGRGFDVVQGAVLVAAAIFVIVNFLVDLTYAWLDPRISYD